MKKILIVLTSVLGCTIAGIILVYLSCLYLEQYQEIRITHDKGIEYMLYGGALGFAVGMIVPMSFKRKV